MIERIEIHPVALPMDRPFAHAGGRRTRTASVLVAMDANGARGWGEGAPRSYVTNETVDTATDAIRAIEPGALNDLVDLTDFGTAMRDLARADLIGLIGGPRPMPAAAAAVEIALFDLACRLHDRDGFAGLRQVPEVTPLLKRNPSATTVSYVLDLSKDPVAGLAAASVEAIRHVKIKATGDVDECVRRVTQVRARFGPATGISIDANGSWDRAAAVRAARDLGPLGVAWLEEPVGPRDWATLRDIRRTGGLPVMLDESCMDIRDIEHAVAAGAVDHVNARISKCGGIFATLALIAAARRHGLGVQLGVHVGEVGPLWAAARLVSCSIDGLVTVEAGKQDEWFPIPLTDPAYRVDRTRYVVEPLGGQGIGIVPNEYLLDQVRKSEVIGGRP